MDQEANTNPTMQPPTPNKDNKRYIILGIAVLAVIIIIGLFLLFTGKNHDKQKAANAPTLTVGSYPYLYACNALSRDDIKKAGVDLADDKGGEAVSSMQAIPYDQTPGGHYDLAQTIEDPLLSGTVVSKCDYIFTEVASLNKKHVTVSVNQYPDPTSAQKVFKTRQDNKHGAPFPSLKETSWVESDSSSEDDAITASMLLGNRVVELKYGVGNVPSDNAGAKLDGLATTIIKNLSNTTVAAQPHNFSGLGSIGTTKLIDACHALDFKKADTILGGLHYEQTNVTNDYNYGKTSTDAPAISAQCSVHFRYSEDDTKQPDYKNQSYDEVATRFPDQLILTIASYPNATDATNAVLGLKKSKANTAVDFGYGATSFAYTQTSTALGFATTTQHFMTVHGSSVLSVGISQGNVQKPYISTVKTITADHAKQLLDSLNLT